MNLRPLPPITKFKPFHPRSPSPKKATKDSPSRRALKCPMNLRDLRIPNTVRTADLNIAQPPSITPLQLKHLYREASRDADLPTPDRPWFNWINIANYQLITQKEIDLNLTHVVNNIYFTAPNSEDRLEALLFIFSTMVRLDRVDELKALIDHPMSNEVLSRANCLLLTTAIETKSMDSFRYLMKNTNQISYLSINTLPVILKALIHKNEEAAILVTEQCPLLCYQNPSDNTVLYHTLQNPNSAQARVDLVRRDFLLSQTHNAAEFEYILCGLARYVENPGAKVTDTMARRYPSFAFELIACALEQNGTECQDMLLKLLPVLTDVDTDMMRGG